MASDVALWPAHEIAAALRRGELTSTDVLEGYLERIDVVNGELNAVVTLDAEGARRAAAAADAARAAGTSTGPLAGVPVTIKDALETAGLRSTGGAIELSGNVPDRDAPAVAAVKAAGAIVFGKTNLPRWSGDLQTFNELFGTTVNPWQPAVTPGGSSGGAAAAVAAGLTAFEIGTDIGGSIRVPASFCGVWGHKPSFGIVPSLGYLDHELGGTIEADVNVIGPLARSVDDLELLLGIIASPTADRATAWRLELPPPRHTDLASYRVAAWLDDPACPVSDDVAALMDQAVSALERAGAKVDRKARPELDLRAASDLGIDLVTAAVTLGIGDEQFERLCAADVAALDPDVAARLDRVTLRHRSWLAAHREREDIRRRWAELFRTYDVLLAPVCASPPFAHQHDGTLAERRLLINGTERPHLDLIRWTILIGMAYLPVTVPPIGRTPAGLPVGIQVVAPFLEDRTALHVARLLADAAGTGYEPPPLARL